MNQVGTAQKPVAPFLKWAGGKRQLLPELLKHVPPIYGRYVEPFLGGGALFFHLRPQHAILSDSNEELIGCYKVVRNNVEALIQVLKEFSDSESFYYEVRAQSQSQLNEIERAARTIYLNKTSFNGLYRVNKAGLFNVPYGRRKSPNICDEPTLFDASEALQSAVLLHGDYLEVLTTKATINDFVFLDPPYHPLGGHADFKRYTKEFFYEADQVMLRDEVRRLVDIGCLVLLTNSNTEFTRKLYDDFEYTIVGSKRLISSKADTRVGQDIVVSATKPVKRTVSSIAYLNHGVEKFPTTRYMGSKQRLLPFIWDCIADLKFSSVLDAFSGTGCVSYMFKRYGKQVASNDFMNFTYHFANAAVANSEYRLEKDTINALLQPNPKAGSFIADTFKGLYFSDKENAFLDSLRFNIDQLKYPYQQSLAISSAVRACMKRRPRGIFTYEGDRYNDGRRDIQLSLHQHFLESVEQFNGAIFDNSKHNMAFNMDVFDLEVDADLVYLDPPYYSQKSDSDYTRRYHFVEGFAKNWQGLQIQQDTKTKKFARYETPFISRNLINDALNRLFQKFQNSILVVSYSSNSLPYKEELVKMLLNYKRHIRVCHVDHRYSFGNQGHKVADNANQAKEYIFVGY